MPHIIHSHHYLPCFPNGAYIYPSIRWLLRVFHHNDHWVRLMATPSSNGATSGFNHFKNSATLICHRKGPKQTTQSPVTMGRTCLWWWKVCLHVAVLGAWYAKMFEWKLNHFQMDWIKTSQMQIITGNTDKKQKMEQVPSWLTQDSFTSLATCTPTVAIESVKNCHWMNPLTRQEVT